MMREQSRSLTLPAKGFSAMAIPVVQLGTERWRALPLRALIADPEFEPARVTGRQSRRDAELAGLAIHGGASTDLNAVLATAAVRRLQRDGRQSAA